MRQQFRGLFGIGVIKGVHMAIDIKNIVAEALLEICKTKDLASITIKDIREKTGISRQGFYNHFRDKNDLIHWIYYDRILTEFHSVELDRDYYTDLKDYYQRAAEYHYFLKPAIRDSGQNCLKDYMFEHPFQWELQYHEKWYEKNNSEKPVMEEVRFFIKYHSLASAGMTIEWIREDMPVTPEQMARRITYLRKIGLGTILNGRDREENLF